MRRQKKKGGQSGRLTKQNYKRRIIAALIWGIVTLCLAISTFYIKDDKTVEFIKWVAGAPIVASLTLVLGNINVLLRCQKLCDVFRVLISSICLWIAVLTLVSGCVVKGAAAWNVMHVEENHDKKDSETEEVDKEQVKVPMRNEIEFVWENDIFIDNVSKYYDKPISKEEEDKYILELLKEDFENNKYNVQESRNGGEFSDAYEQAISLANQYYAQYQNAVNQKFDLAVQYNELYQSKTERVVANDADKVSANLRELGNTEKMLGNLEEEMENTAWQTRYFNALKYYIEGIKCSVQEVDLGWYKTNKESKEVLWQHILKTYDEISYFDTAEGIRAVKVAKLLENINIIQ